MNIGIYETNSSKLSKEGGWREVWSFKSDSFSGLGEKNLLIETKFNPTATSMVVFIDTVIFSAKEMQ